MGCSSSSHDAADASDYNRKKTNLQHYPNRVCLVLFFCDLSTVLAEQKHFIKIRGGQYLKGTTLREALRGNLPLKGVLRELCRIPFKGSAGLSGVLQGSGIFRGP